MTSPSKSMINDVMTTDKRGYIMVYSRKRVVSDSKQVQNPTPNLTNEEVENSKPANPDVVLEPVGQTTFVSLSHSVSFQKFSASHNLSCQPKHHSHS